jgi:hypothetical protein
MLGLNLPPKLPQLQRFPVFEFHEPGGAWREQRFALAPVGRKYDCLERHPTWIAAEFLTQSLRQGVDDSIRIDAAARPDLVD